jgi:hypothetical protein
LRIGVRRERFDVPDGWAAQSGAKLAEIQLTEGHESTIHAALHRTGTDPELIYSLTIKKLRVASVRIPLAQYSQLAVALRLRQYQSM